MISGILKIIGIVFLCIAAFAFALLLSVLFLPFRYKITADGSGKEISANARIKWLFGLARAKISYIEGGVSYKVSVLFFPILKGKIGKKQEAAQNPEKSKKKDKKAKKKAAGKAEEKGKKQTQKEDAAKIKKIKEEEELKDLNPLMRKIYPLCNKLKGLWEKLKTVKYIWDAPVTKRALKFMKIKLTELLNHIKPRRISGRVTFAAESPDLTAKIYAAAALWLEAAGSSLILVPDFEGSGFKAENVDISGRIFAGYMVLLALKILKNKDVRRVVKYIRRNF